MSHESLIARSKTMDEHKATNPAFRFTCSGINRTHLVGRFAILKMVCGALVRIDLDEKA